MKAILLASALALTAAPLVAAPVTYKINPDHTYPSFEADHMGGLSILRGKFNSSSGTVVLDKEGKTGTIDITVNVSSLDFGHDKLNEHAKTEPTMFDAARHPTATYKGKLTKWGGDSPKEVQGQLTLHGVTKPVTLEIHQFLCKPNPMTGREVCGADASATINRADFGITYGVQNFGFKPQVLLRIEVEADRT